jgi:carbon-monoxide dehydrogenase medium subunit
MYDLTYQSPGTLDDAQAMLAKFDDAKVLAGGMSLIPVLKHRLARYSDLVDLRQIDVLRGIRRDGDTLVIGAMSRHAEVAASPLVRSTIPALSVLAGGIGDPLVRNRGTIGGSLAYSDPAADYPAGVLGLGATITTNKRKIAADDYFLGLFETALEKDEIIVSIAFPIPDTAAYAKFANPASRFAIAGVLVARTGADVRVAVTGARACAFRLADAEHALAHNFSEAALDSVAIDSSTVNADIHAGAAYRAHVVIEMAKQATRACVGQVTRA